MIVKDWNKLKSILAEKEKGKKIVFTNGCFDIVHSGHIYSLEQAKALGDVLIVALNTDSGVKRIKGEKRPIINEDERAKLIDSLKPVDYVTFFDENTPEKIIEFLKPDIHVKAGDYTLDRIPEAKIVHSYGGKVEIVDYKKGVSTTEMIKKIKESF